MCKPNGSKGLQYTHPFKCVWVKADFNIVKIRLRQ